jgi:hypothetical protein
MPHYVEVVVVSCSCGMFPLEKAMHRTSAQAWKAAAEHVALNPDLCKPSMTRDMVPAALVSGL